MKRCETKTERRMNGRAGDAMIVEEKEAQASPGYIPLYSASETMP
jgi:hypothetical protein